MNNVVNNLLFLHLWFPELFGAIGGIQTYSNFLLKAFQELDQGFQYEIFLKNDSFVARVILNQSDIKFHFAGDWHRYLLHEEQKTTFLATHHALESKYN